MAENIRYPTQFVCVFFVAYNYWRNWCNFNRANTFNDLLDHPPQVVKRFRKLYRSAVLFYIR